MSIDYANIVQQNKHQLQCVGDWTIAGIVDLAKAKLKLPRAKEITLHGEAIQSMDSAGAWLIRSIIYRLEQKKIKVHLQSFADDYMSLLDLVSREEILKPLPAAFHPSFLYVIGETSINKLTQFVDFLAFAGEFFVRTFNSFVFPRHIHWRAFLNTIHETGYQALPIVALLSFLIGIVLSYQIGQQLKFYGANLYIDSLLGVAVLQEFAPLITAIIVAGRTGSAYTAQIGSMKINEEIDALHTMGISPFDQLVLPKVFGLIVALPLLIVWADIFGILGGMVMAKIQLGLSYYGFLQLFPKVVYLSTFFNGLSKAPVFAFIISIVGCFQAFQVKYSADSLGARTTKSVVQAIFFIIIADSVFSVMMTWQRIQ